MSTPILISLGGSLIYPNTLDLQFLKRFKKLIVKFLKQGKRFFIITGGGKICRDYQRTAGSIVSLTNKKLDWLGIYTTRLNAHILKMIFEHWAYPKIVTNPSSFRREPQEPLIIAAGWKPGFSTDYVSVKLAEKHKITTILNLTNIDYVYSQDPKFNKAKPIKEISWQDFRKLLGREWNPGLSFPFDPVASKLAEKLKLKVIIMNGHNFQNIENCLKGKRYKGTIIF